MGLFMRGWLGRKWVDRVELGGMCMDCTRSEVGWVQDGLGGDMKWMCR